MELVYLIAIAAASYLLGYQRGVNYCTGVIKDLIEESEQQPQSNVIDCRVEKEGDQFYIFQIQDNSESFLVQGHNATEIAEKLGQLSGKGKHHYRVVGGDAIESLRESLEKTESLK